MAYVLDYTIFAGGVPYTVSATDHWTAVQNFISKPVVGAGYRTGNYEVTDGEKLTVIGPEQEAYAYHYQYGRSLENARIDAAKTGKGSREAKARLASLENRRVDAPPSVAITYTMRAVTSFTALTDEQVLHEGIVERVLKPQFEEVIAEGIPVRLSVSTERQYPIGKLLTGVPGGIDDSGVWLNGKLIPWEDIVRVDAAEEDAEVVA